MTELPLEDRPHTLYRFFAADGRLLYIGITVSARSRWAHHEWTKSWWPEVTDCKLEHFPNRASVLDAEEAAIRDERPIHNVVHNGITPGAPHLPDLPDDLPLQYTQETIEVKGRPLSFALRWQLQHGRMVCVGMRVCARAHSDIPDYPQPEGMSGELSRITTSMLRSPAFPASIRKQRLVLMDQLANEVTVTEDAVRVRRGVRSAKIYSAAAAQFYRAAQEQGSSAPTEAVADAMGVSRSQASRYVRAARDAGLLPPAGPGGNARVPYGHLQN